MSIMHFQSTVSTGEPVNIEDASVTDNAVLPETASAQIRFNSNGTLDLVGASTVITTWYNNAPEVGVGSDYEIRLTVQSGSAPNTGDTPGVWVSLANLKVWSLDQGSLGTSNGTWLVEIRRSGQTNPLTSAVYTMSATTGF